MPKPRARKHGCPRGRRRMGSRVRRRNRRLRREKI